MKILFIYPYEKPHDHQAFEFECKGEYPVQFNFGIATLSSVLKADGHDVMLVPLHAEKEYERILDHTEKLKNAEVFAFSFSEAEMSWVGKISHLLKKHYPQTLQVCGGVGPTLNPDVAFEMTAADHVCVGEGEFALTELLRRHAANESTVGITNMHTRVGKQIYLSEIGQIVDDLDCLPRYDFELFDSFPLKHLQSKMPRLYYLSERNCIFNCSFCANGRKKMAMGLKPGARYVRRFSPQRVIDDLLYLRSMYPDAGLVQFNDEIIHADARWFEEFACLYRDAIGLPWRSYACLAILDARTVELMKLSNCYRVNVGIEAGSERIRKEIYCRPFITNEQMIQKMNMLRSAGIGIHGSNLFGAPTETIDEMIETILVNAKGNVDVPVSGIVVPYKNTGLYDICLKLDRLDCVAYNNDGVSIKPEPGVTREQITFLHLFTAELVKVAEYALKSGGVSGQKIIEFLRWVISCPEIDHQKLCELHKTYFWGKTLDMIYDKMESKYGRNPCGIVL